MTRYAKNEQGMMGAGKSRNRPKSFWRKILVEKFPENENPTKRSKKTFSYRVPVQKAFALYLHPPATIFRAFSQPPSGMREPVLAALLGPTLSEKIKPCVALPQFSASGGL
jgi:hypothetical protein